MPESGAALSYTAHSAQLSPGGGYLTVGDEQTIARGAILAVSILIPRADRRAFPFSRIAGFGRVVRVDARRDEVGAEQGLALAWCEPSTTLLGALVSEEQRPTAGERT